MKKNKTNKYSRRDFIRTSAVGTAGLTFSAKSYARILGANDRVRFAVAGVNGRGQALVKAILANENTAVTYICDVDSRVLEKVVSMTGELNGSSPQGIRDYRLLMEKDDLDAVAIAAPDHWHAYMAVMAMNNGKNVYVEKPSAHNPAEGIKLLETQKSTGKTLQVGTQQRSAPTTIQAIKDIKGGAIGEAYFAKAWYSNNRGTIGRGKVVNVPEWLDWDLWQGPAPREEFRDNIVHYNWHWFRNWGTGEVHNNGTHEIDICRLALGVDYPDKVSLNGGRYQFADDWEFYDTQIVNYEFGRGKLISWEGKSCNNFKYLDKGRGTTVHGTEGTVFLDRNTYILFDPEGKEVQRMYEARESETTDTMGEGALDKYHFENFLGAIREGVPLNAPIEEAHKTNMLCHYGNMSQFARRSLEVDSKTGKVMNSNRAMKLWGREYEEGWEI